MGANMSANLNNNGKDERDRGHHLVDDISPHPYSVLLVHPGYDEARFFQGFFQSNGVECTIQDRYDETRILNYTSHVDAILIDATALLMNHDQIIRKVGEVLYSSPVIILTTERHDELNQLVLSLGIDGIFFKDRDHKPLHAFLSQVRVACERGRRLKRFSEMARRVTDQVNDLEQLGFSYQSHQSPAVPRGISGPLPAPPQLPALVSEAQQGNLSMMMDIFKESRANSAELRIFQSHQEVVIGRFNEKIAALEDRVNGMHRQLYEGTDAISSRLQLLEHQERTRQEGEKVSKWRETKIIGIIIGGVLALLATAAKLIGNWFFTGGAGH